MPAKFKLPDPDAPVQGTITVGELITMCQTQAMKVGTNKTNRLLLMNCAYTIRQLTQRLAQYEPLPEEPVDKSVM